jgi:hypothetical protein
MNTWGRRKTLKADLVDLLNLSTTEIINAFPDKVLHYIHLFDWGENEYDEDQDDETSEEV